MRAKHSRTLKHFRALGFCSALLLTGAVAVTHTTPVHAQAVKRDKKKAITHFKAAKKALAAKDYQKALGEFLKADSLYPGANPKYHVALCLDKLGKVAEAVEKYKAFIALKPVERASKAKSKAKYTKMVQAASARVAALEATLPATVTLQLAPGNAANLAVMVDGAKVQGTVLSLKAGAHKIQVTADGHQPFEQTVTVSGNQKMNLAVTLQAVAATPPPAKTGAPPPPPPPPPKTRSNVPAYVTLGVAGAGAILGTVFGIQALGAKSDFDENPTVDNADKAERAALIADMSFGVALTFGITGAVLLFSGSSPVETGLPDIKLRPMVGPKGGGMAATWTF